MILDPKDSSDLSFLENSSIPNNFLRLRDSLVSKLAHIPRKYFDETAKTHAKLNGEYGKKVAKKNFSTIVELLFDLHDYDEEYLDFRKKGEDNPLEYDVGFEFSPFLTSGYHLDFSETFSEHSRLALFLKIHVYLMNKENIKNQLLQDGKVSEETSKDEVYEKSLKVYSGEQGFSTLGAFQGNTEDVHLYACFLMMNKKYDLIANLDMKRKLDTRYLKRKYSSSFEEKKRKYLEEVRPRNCERVLTFVPMFDEFLGNNKYYSYFFQPKKDKRETEKAMKFAERYNTSS